MPVETDCEYYQREKFWYMCESCPNQYECYPEIDIDELGD